MQRDILDIRQVDDVTKAANDLAGAVATKNADAVAGLAEKLDRQLERAFPRQPFAGLRENVEVFLVAAIVAMAVRTFFIQPFKIPTGSMQPTLYGIYPPEPGLLPYTSSGKPSLPEMIFGVAWQGKIYQQHGYRSRGDHIFVDRFTYHFRKPKRGEVVVFDTTDIAKIPESSRGKFYIKRLIGLAGDKIQIKPPYVLIGGEILNGRPAFQKMYDRDDGRSGYVLPRGFPPPEYFRSEDDVYQVPPKSLFPLGDNSTSSLDGRYWGSFHEKALVGRAVLVYWPFTKRFGLID
ncbi:MAG: signal peptidase I [Verrucomicrobiota bacterium]